MKILLFGIVVVVLGAGAVAYGHYLNEDYIARIAEYETVVENIQSQKNFLKQVDNAKNRHELIALEGKLSAYPKDFQDKVGPHIGLRIISTTFDEADDIFDRARKLQLSLVLPEPEPQLQQSLEPQDDPYKHAPMAPPPPPKIPEIHPVAQALADKAMPLYEEMKKRIDKMSNIDGDDNYNFAFHYTKGEVYYRYMQFFGTQETIKELYKQTVNEFKLALRYKPGDVNTVINIELLIKNDPGGGQNSEKNRQKMLNQSAGFGRSKGN